MNNLEKEMINGRVSRYKDRFPDSSNSTAFGYFVLDQLFPDIAEDLPDLITEGANDCGIDAVYLSKEGDCNHIHLFQFKFHENEAGYERNFPSNEIDKCLAFIKSIYDMDAALQGCCNAYLWEKVQEIWDVISKANTKITVYFTSNGKPLIADQKNRIVSALSGYRTVDFKEIVFSDLINFIVKSQAKDKVYTLHACDKQIFERTDGNIKGLVATVAATEFVNALSENSDGVTINKEIFDLNIRAYLSSDTSVNKEIIKTALSDDRHLFWYLNNGITAVCSSFSYSPGARNPEILIENLRIVNGAQTSGALFEAYKADKERLDDVVVTIRLYETKDEHLPEKIAIATNSQNRILNRDLMSNMPILRKLEEAFSDKGFYLERKKFQHDDKPLIQQIDALKLGQVIMGYIQHEPEKAKTESDKIFGSKFDEIFTNALSPEKLVNIYQLFQIIDERKKIIDAQKRKSALRDSSESFLSYGLFHTLYIASILADKRGLEVEIQKDREKLADLAIQITKDYVISKKSQALYTLFRSPRTKEEMLELATIKRQLELPLDVKVA